jgi:hypothetical protein
VAAIAAHEIQKDKTSWKNQNKAWFTNNPESPTRPKAKATLVLARGDLDIGTPVQESRYSCVLIGSDGQVLG